MTGNGTETSMKLFTDQAARRGKQGGNKAAKKFYAKELQRLQIELVKLQEWIKKNGLKVVVVFEGRDAAGKGVSSNGLPRV